MVQPRDAAGRITTEPRRESGPVVDLDRVRPEDRLQRTWLGMLPRVRRRGRARRRGGAWRPSRAPRWTRAGHWCSCRRDGHRTVLELAGLPRAWADISEAK